MNLVSRLFTTFALGLAAAGAVAIFHYVGGFPVQASILLGFAFTIVAVWLHGLRQLAAFEPYSVEIFVNFDALREALGLEKRMAPNDDGKPVHELYNFTAISAALFVHYREYVTQTAEERSLTGRSTRTDDEFRSLIQFGGTIPGSLKYTAEWENPQNRCWFPRFIFSPGWKGFELRIQVVPEWWAEYKKHLSPGIRDLKVDYDGFIVLAHLPYGFIPDHVRRLHKPTNLLYPFNANQRRWASKLASQGWTIEEYGEEAASRFMIVRYQRIWPTS